MRIRNKHKVGYPVRPIQIVGYPVRWVYHVRYPYPS